MASAHQVAAAIRRDLSAFVADRVGVIISSVHEELTRSTPVDTGFGAGSYYVDLDGPAPPSGLEDEGAANRALRAVYAQASAEAARTSLAQAINRFKVSLRSDRKVDSIHITNWVWYVDARLDRGTSPKAPAGFVAAAIERGVARGV